MQWTWQHPDWPHFRFTPAVLASREALFLRQAGVVIGTVRHIPENDRVSLTVDLISAEALKTAEIEGELLDRDSVQSSLCRQFGLPTSRHPASPAEQGIAEMLVDLYRHWEAPLDDETLFRWHRSIMSGRSDVDSVGRYRSHEDPMQVVSGRLDRPRVHFEAPPVHAVAAQMAEFCRWFNETKPTGSAPLPALPRAGIAHLYFESIHPFEDGNGRIGRAVAEKALAQSAGQPSLTALSVLIHRHRRDYYRQLERASRALDIDAWLDWFADLVIAAQTHTLQGIEFLLVNARLWDRLRGQLNPRQEKALSRLMRSGVEGFSGGLSAHKYRALTGAPPATATRDLAQLVDLGALRRTGQLKGTRYWLAHCPATSDALSTELRGTDE